MSGKMAAAGLAAILSAAAMAQEAAPLAPDAILRVKGDFLNGKGETSRDVSGVACRPQENGRRICVVIDDESRFAQVAVLDGDTLTAGKRIELIDKDREGSIFGAPPDEQHCGGGEEKFKNLDGEGVAYAAPYFYVVGSHGCTRNKDLFMPSAFVTARFRLDADGELIDAQGRPASPKTAVEATYRLWNALAAADSVSKAFAAPLKGEDAADDGLNVEGVAVIGDLLYAGARAPSIDAEAFIVGARIADLFAPGPASAPMQITQLAVGLGPNSGIRDLAALPDGKLLILSGPTQDDPATPYSLFVADPQAKPTKAHRVARLEDMMMTDSRGAPLRAKAEAATALDLRNGTLRVLVLYDGPPNGSPRTYRLAVP